MKYIKIIYELYFTSIACFLESFANKKYHQGCGGITFDATSGFYPNQKFSGSISNSFD
jgi:hypothetical protein